MKTCPKCKKNLSLEMFGNNRASKDGYSFYCKLCSRKIDKKRRSTKEGKDKHRLSNKRWHENTKEERKEYNKKRRECPLVKEQRRKSSLNYYYRHKEKINNKMREKIQTDKAFHLKRKMGSSIWQSLKKNKKGHHWEDLVGYTVEDLKKHLESKFKPEMTWDNYGKYGWHIDHIIPQSWFKFNSYEDEEFKKCWSLDNLQPIWAKENWSKNNRFVG